MKTLLALMLTTCLFCGCDKGNHEQEEFQPETEIGVFGEDWHYCVQHNTGHPTENEKGCPCVCLMMGYSSHANMTNALNHGFGSVYEEYSRTHNSTDGCCHLNDIWECEKEIMRKIKEVEEDKQ